MGQDLGVNSMFIMAISLEESGVSGTSVTLLENEECPSNGQPLNNLFGSTYGGADNIAYPTIQASAVAWESNWGPYLRNSPQTIGAFTADLTSNRSHMYNSSAGWPGLVSRVYDTLLTEFTDCNLTFPGVH